MANTPVPVPVDVPTVGAGCTVERVGGAEPLLRLHGDLDRDAAPRVEAVLRASLSGDRPHVVRLDLGPLTFVDVEGVRLLGRVQRAAAARGARLVLLHVRPLLREVARVVAPDLLAAEERPGRPGPRGS
ncbi:STAS domain-containing protein [Cellulomonas sp. JZ18]|uniref:STAS domain-containing protein n=1 Tax=Cellulomonas sp. JZ18 TaxID=2654191 RepID=UPI0018AFDA52|nr:STAS domain-containing protein [Cellulomonas sp. JZ18]